MLHVNANTHGETVGADEFDLKKKLLLGVFAGRCGGIAFGCFLFHFLASGDFERPRFRQAEWAAAVGPFAVFLHFQDSFGTGVNATVSVAAGLPFQAFVDGHGIIRRSSKLARHVRQTAKENVTAPKNRGNRGVIPHPEKAEIR